MTTDTTIDMIGIDTLHTITLDALAQVSGAFSFERAFVSGAQWAPVGAAAGGAIGSPVGAAIGGLATSPALGVGAIPGLFYGSMVGGAVGTAAGWLYGVGKDTYHQLTAPAGAR